MKLLLTIAAPVLALLAPLAGDDEIVREFKKYFRKYKDTPTRVEAVMALADAQVPGVVSVLSPILKDREPEVVEAAVRVLSGLEDRASVDALFEELESARKDEVRLGLLRAVAAGRYEGAQPYVLPALTAKDWETRRAAVRALTALAGEGSAEALLPLCADGEVAVRCAVLEGLAKLGSAGVVEPAIAALSDPSWQVRASSISALGQVRRVEAIGPLIELMKLEEGRLREDIGRSLGEITGRNFGQRVDGWENFWSLYSDRFVIPTDEELAKLRKVQAERREHYSPSEGGVSYHGIESPTRSLLFVIDVSGSMENEVVDRERFEDGDYPSFSRMDIVKTELQRTIEGLESYVSFNVLAFATDVREWKRDLVRASPVNKSSAVDWVGRLEPLGGKSREHLARAGLAGSAGLEHGKTNTYGALMAALGVDEGGRGDDYETVVDTIFFLSDGRPSTGRYVDTNDILKAVLEANDLRKIVIHTIAIGQFRKQFMRGLADSSGGVFVDLGN